MVQIDSFYSGIVFSSLFLNYRAARFLAVVSSTSIILFF